MNILIGVSHAGICTMEMATTMVIMAHHQGKAGHDLDILASESCLTADNASAIVEEAAKLKCDYLFFLDTDVQYLGVDDVLGKMIAHDKDVVGGVYYQGHWPYRPVCYKFTEDGLIENFVDIPPELFKCDCIGMGFTLIKKHVLDIFTYEASKRMGRAFDSTFKDNTMEVKLRADAAFYWRLKQLGIEVWADGSITLAHVKKNLITSQQFNSLKSSLARREDVEKNAELPQHNG